jgi:hypothetical protein
MIIFKEEIDVSPLFEKDLKIADQNIKMQDPNQFSQSYTFDMTLQGIPIQMEKESYIVYLKQSVPSLEINNAEWKQLGDVQIGLLLIQAKLKKEDVQILFKLVESNLVDCFLIAVTGYAQSKCSNAQIDAAKCELNQQNDSTRLPESIQASSISQQAEIAVAMQPHRSFNFAPLSSESSNIELASSSSVHSNNNKFSKENETTASSLSKNNIELPNSSSSSKLEKNSGYSAAIAMFYSLCSDSNELFSATSQYMHRKKKNRLYLYKFKRRIHVSTFHGFKLIGVDKSYKRNNLRSNTLNI